MSIVRRHGCTRVCRAAKGKTEKAGKEHETRKGDRKHQDKKKGKQKARGAYRSEKAGQTQRRQPRDT